MPATATGQFDVNTINPFVEAVHSVFTTMLNTEPKRTALRIGQEPAGPHSLTALIGISGEKHGVVVLRFPEATARTLAGRMLGVDFDTLNEEVIDAISEITNMVGGAAKAKFDTDPPLDLGLPTVVEGNDYQVRYPTKSVWLAIPYETDAGKFSMEITFSAAEG